MCVCVFDAVFMICALLIDIKTRNVEMQLRRVSRLFASSSFYLLVSSFSTADPHHMGQCTTIDHDIGRMSFMKFMTSIKSMYNLALHTTVFQIRVSYMPTELSSVGIYYMLYS